MTTLHHFVPRSEIDAAENLREFIRACRYELTVFGEKLDWADWRWPKAMFFTRLGSHSRAQSPEQLNSKFIDFAKAYFRYQQGHNPTGAKNEAKALRVIEATLLTVKRDASIGGLDFAVLDEAARLGRSNYSAATAYQCGREIERLARFVSEKRLIPNDIGTWKSPFKRPVDISIQTGAKAQALHQKKLPDEYLLNAIAEIFALDPQDPRDIFTSATFAMTMCAPSRISEILELPVDCEVEELDSKGVQRYGWRFFSGKGYEGDIKWIPTVMIPVARAAVRRIRAITEEPRRLALSVETQPRTAYHHAACPCVDNDMPLTVEQACAYLGLAHGSRRLCTSGLGVAGLEAQDGVHTLTTLWQHASLRQPQQLPWLSKEKRVKFSGALFCMTRNFLHAQRGTSPLILWSPDANTFNNDLSPRPTVGGAHRNIFERFGYRGTDGKAAHLTSHQARHLLNTIANRGGLSQAELARWSGRADAKQNRVYNHMSEFEMVAKAEALDKSLTLFGPTGVVALNLPVSDESMSLVERGAVHVTEFGFCIHDYTMSPCEKFRDCINCDEQVCMKGDEVRLGRVKARLAEVERDLIAARAAMQGGFTGADRWVEHHEKTVARLRQLVVILESPEVPDGSQIKLRDGKDYSHVRRAIAVRTGDNQALPNLDSTLENDVG